MKLLTIDNVKEIKNAVYHENNTDIYCQVLTDRNPDFQLALATKEIASEHSSYSNDVYQKIIADEMVIRGIR